MASLFTGLQPWRHGNWHADRARLAEDLVTLPEALHDAGYRTVAFRSNTWLRQQFGYAQGFDLFQGLGHGKRAEAKLESLDGGRDFVWVHVLPPHSPYERWAHLLDRLPEGTPADLPQRVRAADLEPFFDPAAAPSPEQLAAFRALYRLNVAYADEVAGKLLDALRRSGHWDDALVMVTADHGEEFEENGQIAHGGSLHRVLIEVPLVIKLPRESGRRLAARPAVANHRLFATVLELCGIPTPGRDSGVLPSLFEDDSPALSELYYGNGVNSFSLVSVSTSGNGEQVLASTRFAAPESGYYSARRRSLGLTDGAVAEEPAVLFARLRSAFLATPPLRDATGAAPEVELRAWPGASSVVDSRGGARNGVDDRAAAPALFDRVATAWQRWNGEIVTPASIGPAPDVELSPEERDQLEALGYVVESD
jgi:hypothetical protein